MNGSITVSNFPAILPRYPVSARAIKPPAITTIAETARVSFVLADMF